MPHDSSQESLRILHLSDFHFSEGTEWDAVPVLKGLVKAVEQLVTAELTPDVVAITGDVAHSGKKSEYEDARTWIDDKLLAVLPKLSKERILIVPGNHDVDRNLVKGNVAAQAVQERLLMTRSQDDIANVLGSATQRDLLLNRQGAYLEFAKAYGGSPTWLKVPWWSTVIDLQQSRVFFAGLCSSWMSWRDADRGNLLIGRWQIYNVFDDSADDADFRVVLAHHPWDYLAEFDQREVEQTIHRKADLVLRGHRHTEESTQISDPHSACVELAAGSAYGNSRHPNGFHLIELQPDRRAVRVHYRMWDGVEWIVDRNAYKTARRGVAKFPLAKRVGRCRVRRKAAAPPADPTRYLRRLRGQTEHIDIRGLEVGSGRATKLPIDELYIPLATTATVERRADGKHDRFARDELERAEAGSADLRETLKHRCLVVVGDPGSGKSTFLRRIAFELCRRQLGESVEEADPAWSSLGTCFPILIPLADLAKHMAKCDERKKGPLDEDASCWLTDYAATRCSESDDPLDETFFRERLKAADTIVLLDGLDEPPTADQRIAVRKLIERTANVHSSCRFVVTTRPAAYKGKVLLASFEETRIDSLTDEAIAYFLGAWSDVLWRGNKPEAERHLKTLLDPIRQRPEIRRLARNPVMLTALAVVHWNETSLPLKRADLYESIIKWLSKSREARSTRPSPDRCVTWLQELALAMQDQPEGRQTQVSLHWGARAIAPEFRGCRDEQERISKAEAFLREEEIDSGIIVGRGEHDIRFWHLTFQEYLAARALSAYPDTEQARRLLITRKLHQQEWREVVLLLAGVLYNQGARRMDTMFDTILGQLLPKATLSEKARCVGLLGAILYELSPATYQPPGDHYDTLLKEVMVVFHPEESQAIGIEEAIEAAEAIGQASDPRFVNLSSPDLWVTIPAGTFRMGAQKADRSRQNYDPCAWGEGMESNEAPVHLVTLQAYRIGRYPVTVGEYRRFVKDGGYEDERFWTAGGFGRWDTPGKWEEQLAHPTRPVVRVSWYEASAYAASVGRRLPTEAEWERAARGLEGRRYPWGDTDTARELSNRLNYAESRIGHSTPVGVYPLGATPEPERVLDMAGNVWEWCSDRYGPYDAGEQENPIGPREGEHRVLRGGAWDFDPTFCRAARRCGIEPASRSDNVGFRVAAGPEDILCVR